MTKLEHHRWQIATLIKLVAEYDIDSICFVAKQLRKYYDPQDIDKVDNNIVYDCYCKYEEGTL